MLRRATVGLWRSPARAAGLRLLSSQPARGGVGVGAAIGGMAVATGIGIGIGLALPGTSRPGGDSAALSVGQRNSTVYEDAEDIASHIERPAMIQDANRDQIEALYEFGACLASGGSGSVWRATERRSGRQVAIKVIDKKLLLTSLLHMEVYAMQRCAGHPHIIQLLAAYEVSPDSVNSRGEWHLVMELARGGELFSRLVQHGAYSEKLAAALIAQVARAVYHLHSCGVCHRDIKVHFLRQKVEETPLFETKGGGDATF